MNDEEKQKVWSTRNEIADLCRQAIKDLARQDFDKTVINIMKIVVTIETFYKENAN